MKVPAAKVEKCASRDQSRPVLASVYLRVVDEAKWKSPAEVDFEPGSGFLEATDSYKLVRVPVELEPGDVEGFIPPESLVAARKANRHEPRLSANGTVDVVGGPSYARPELGTFPNTDQLIPEESRLWGSYPGQPFEIGLNAKLLLELAQGLGSDTVRIAFCRGTGNGHNAELETDPSALRPMTVRPFGRGADPDAIGILMPIRVSI